MTARIASGVSPQQILTWRQKMRITQAEAADRLGISRKTFQDYETGTLPTPVAIWRACKLLWLTTPEARVLMSKPLRNDLLDWLAKYATDL